MNDYFLNISRTAGLLYYVSRAPPKIGRQSPLEGHSRCQTESGSFSTMKYV